MAKVLVIGGAGYVGSTTTAWLLDHGHDVWILDDLSRGHRQQVLTRGFTHARAGDQAQVEELLLREKFECVMHFAAYALVSESVSKQAKYFENNVEQTRKLLDSMLKCDVRRFVFSSTCAVYGDPGAETIHEGMEPNPANPYGETKLRVELELQRLSRKMGLQSIALRYFNAAGAEPKMRVGEWHEPETHLIPRVLDAALQGKPVEIYGTDYPTRDGTCVRDYIHVWDLAAAHGAAMQRLLDAPEGGSFEAINLGSEKGFSVREIVAAAEKVVGKRIQVVEKPRRPGDPPVLVADSSRARQELGFFPQASSIDGILASAWEWEKKMSARKVKAVFLDRDGTINDDPGYLSHAEQMTLLPGAAEALGEMKRLGYMLVVVSNQSGVGRGLIKLEEIPKIHDRLDELAAPFGGQIDRYELCFHRPEDDCACRKPKPKLLLDAASDLGIDLASSYMVGDKITDVEVGRVAGCKGVALVRTGYGREAEPQLQPGAADFIGDSLKEVARWIAAQETAAT